MTMKFAFLFLSYLIDSSVFSQEENLQPLPYVKNLKNSLNHTGNLDDESATLGSQDTISRNLISTSVSTFRVTDPQTVVPVIVPQQKSPKFSVPGDATCQTKGKCTTPTSPLTCYGTRLPYSQTGPSFLGPSSSLDQWAGLQEVPACWDAVQPLLCSAFLPKCEAGQVHRVPRHLCKRAQKPCRIIPTLLSTVPDFLNCSNEHIFTDCRGAELSSERVRFNLSSTTCVSPLLYTKISSAYFPDLDQCGMKCQSPLLSPGEYSRIHGLVGVGGGVSLVCSLFAVLTFLVDWKGGCKYPALAIFYMNLCFLAISVGWLAQFSPGGRQDIVCRRDGTARQAEPGAGENLSCTVVFVLVYYFSIAASVWLCILAYTWSVSFTTAQQGNKGKEVIEARAAYFHMVAWSLPLVLTIVIMAMNKVDGSAITGICFVGYTDPMARSVFVLAPHCLALLVAGCFTWRSLAVLGRVWLGATTNILSESASGKVKSTLVRMSVFSALTTLCIVVTVICHIYRFSREEGWGKALRELVECNLKQSLGSNSRRCQVVNKPSVAVLQLELLVLFLAGVLASSWVWTRESLNTWTFTVKQLINKEENQRPLRLRKHELIAQAFSKRNELQANGRLSLTFQSAHDDPLGLDLQGDETSGEFSSGWAAALPHLVTRRGGLCGADQLGLGRRNSLDSVSNVSRSISIRSARFSWFGSRKGSVDSQSIQQTDLDRLQSIYDQTLKSSKKRSKREFFKSHRSKMKPWSRMSSRRNSVTSRTSTGDNSSVFSQISQVLPAITLDPKKLTKKALNKFTLPEPGRSTDFGRDTRPPPTLLNDPTYKELEEKLRTLANASRTSRDTDREGEGLVAVSFERELARPQQLSVSVQTSITDLSSAGLRKPTVTTGTQVSPVMYRLREAETSTEPSSKTDSLPPLVSPASSSASPLQHVEANVVNIRLLGPSSEDSSIPSSYEKDYKMKKLSLRGKENLESSSINVEDVISIPVLRPMQSREGGGLLKPRDHHRGRRGAIVQKLSPKQAGDTATDS